MYPQGAGGLDDRRSPARVIIDWTTVQCKTYIDAAKDGGSLPQCQEFDLNENGDV